MILSLLYIILGLVLILAGANWLTDGAAAIARRFGLSDLVVGLTVIAFGTSAPELTISILSSVEGNAGLAVGNVVGSNIFNILVIIGVTAMVRPMHVGSGLLTKDIPMVLLSSLVLLAMGNAVPLDGATESMLTRVDGIILLLFFAVFMRYTFSQARQSSDNADSATGAPRPKMLRASLLTVIGLAMLIFGGDLFVDGATDLATLLGVSDTVIGLTVAAVGTSLPELATSITAAVKGKPGLALGNVIGSNIFNIFLVLGSAATIRPVAFGTISNIDLLTLTGASLLFLAFGRFFGNHRINRIEGSLLFACYLVYISILIILRS